MGAYKLFTLFFYRYFTFRIRSSIYDCLFQALRFTFWEFSWRSKDAFFLYCINSYLGFYKHFRFRSCMMECVDAYFYHVLYLQVHYFFDNYIIKLSVFKLIQFYYYPITPIFILKQRICFCLLQIKTKVIHFTTKTNLKIALKSTKTFLHYNGYSQKYFNTH